MSDQIPRSMMFRILIRILLLPVSMAVLILWPADDWFWVDGWLVILAFTLLASISVIWLIKEDPNLVKERMKGNFQKGQRTKDTLIIIVLTIVMLAIFPVAGYDHANNLLQLYVTVKIVGWILFLISIFILYKVFKTNAFLSRSIVIQADRKQEVVKSGAYGVIRHPMYSAILVMIIGISLIMGSGLALIPTLLSGVVLYWRATSEEELLLQELDGYDKYQQEVKYRLIPKII